MTFARTPDKPRSAARVLRALAFAACVPYLALKIAWGSGSRVGIPDGSTLLEDHATMVVGSIESALLDSMVVVLALLLTQPWGRRVPVWPLILPAWAATGLLSPIVVGYPVQLGARLLGGGAAPAGGPAARPFLHEWVCTVVYTGFIAQALALLRRRHLVIGGLIAVPPIGLGNRHSREAHARCGTR